MDRRTLLTISTAACLCGAYEVYALFVSPWFAPGGFLPPPHAPRPDDAPATVPEYQTQARMFLADEPWTHDAKYQFRNDAGYFYFSEWDRVDETGEVRFTPFAMIWRPKDHDPEKAPFVIISDSALVRFAEKFEITNRNPGRVVGGALEGTVRVRGPDGLSIEGKHFHFAEQALRIWSDHAVRFAYGPHKGRGEGLELDLIPSTGPVSEDKPAVSGVRTIRLIKDVQMDLVPGAAPRDEPVETVRVTSQGSFEYDVEAHVATFQKVVHVERPTGPGQSDRLNCDVLTLIFEPEEAAGGEQPAVAAEPKPSQEGFDGGARKLAFRRLRAEGATIASDRSQVQGRMNELTYDEQARVVVLRDGKQVRILQKNNELLCPEITAVLDEDKQIERAVCRGAGQLFRYAADADLKAPRADRQVELAAQWQTQLEKAPDAVTGLDLIEFRGQAVLNQTGKMGLKGDIVRIWVTRPEKEPEGRRRRDPAAPAEDEKIQPKKLLALRDVAFSSPQIGGHTDRLEVWFEEGPLPAPPPLAQQVGGLRHQALKAAEQAPAAFVGQRATEKTGRNPAVRGPGASQAVTVAYQSDATATRGSDRSQALARVDDERAPRKARGTRSPPPPKKPDRSAPENPLAVRAELIRVQALRDGEKTEIAEVVTQGRVHVTQDHAAGEAPLELTGDRLHLWNYSESNQVLRLEGRPAQIRDRGMQLEGPDIHFDRGHNDARVDGAGVLRLPMTKGLNGKPLDAPQLLNIFWREKMDFDGQLARFFSRVRTETGGTEIRCEEMHVTFTTRISFAETASDSQNTEVQYVVCRDGVDLKSHEYENNRLTQVRWARGFEFAIDQATGRTTAQGPGRIDLWRRGNGRRAGLAPNSAALANKGLEADTTEWEYTRIDFDGKMEGNTNDRVTTFRDRKDGVRVVYGPVAHSNDVLDEDNLPKDGGWMKCSELTLTQQPEKGDRKAYYTMQATDNAELDGRSFHALAHIITYDESKGLYVLTGDGRRDARIWHERKVGAERAVKSAQRFEFMPATNSLKIIDASSGQAFQ